MFYSEKIPNNTKSTIRVSLSDFSKGINTVVTENLLPLNYAVNSYNFDFNSRSLKEGLGISTFSVYNGTVRKNMFFPSGKKVLKFWHFRRYDKTINEFSPLMMIYCDDKKMYVGRLVTQDANFYDLGITFDTIPECFNYRLDDKDCFVCCAPNKIVVYDGNTSPKTYTENVPSITSAALHAGRLFVTTGGDESQLWFSDDLDPTNWNVNSFDGGYIELTDDRGTLKKVIESNNYLYVIREYGISRVSGWGLQEDFTVKNLYLSTGKIYHNSAVLCGSVIMMLCRDGIYRFSGSSMQKLDLGIDKYFEGIDNKNAVGAFLDGKYYLACRLMFNDNVIFFDELKPNYVNNALIEYDIITGAVNIMRGIDISTMTAFQTEWGSELILCVNNSDNIVLLSHDGKFILNKSPKVWTSPYTDMGYPSRRKVIKNIYLNTKDKIEIAINADGTKYTFPVEGDSNPVRVPINVSAKKFNISFSSDTAKCEISNPEIEVEIC